MEKQPMGSDDFTDITPPSKQSEPPPLLVFGIVCVIVFFGVLFVLRQSPETPTSPSEPVKINYEHARLALRQPFADKSQVLSIDIPCTYAYITMCTSASLEANREVNEAASELLRE